MTKRETITSTSTRATAFLVLLMAAAGSLAAESAVTVKLEKLKFGAMKYRSHKATGSEIQEYWACRNVHEQTDQIPMIKGRAFGFNARIRTNWGTNLVLLTHWTRPDSDGKEIPAGEGSGRFMYARNGGKVRTCYRFEKEWELLPGEWNLSVYLLGIDESISAVKESFDQRQPMLVFSQTFNVYEPR